MGSTKGKNYLLIFFAFGVGCLLTLGAVHYWNQSGALEDEEEFGGLDLDLGLGLGGLGFYQLPVLAQGQLQEIQEVWCDERKG